MMAESMSPPDEKLCKYSYTSWCPTCERDSPRRRRTKSETLEPSPACRRRGKEMKKTFKSQYNNAAAMELEQRVEFRELPTTYITNNCQQLSNHTNTELFDHNRKFPPPHAYDNENSITMNTSNNEKLTRSFVVDERTNLQQQQHYNSLASKSFNHFTNVKLTANSNLSPRSVLTKYDRLLKSHDETCTFFDCKQFDPKEVRERYSRELEILREKLKDLRNHKYSPIKPPTIIKNLDKYAKQNGNVNLSDIKIIEHVATPKIDTPLGPPPQPPPPRSGGGRISVKTSRRLRTKTVSTKSKQQLHLQTASAPKSESECESDSEEGSDKEELPSGKKCLPQVTSVIEKKCDTPKASGDAPSWPLRESLFPHIPPYIKFNLHGNEPNNLPTGRRYLKWKLSNITPIVVRKTLTNTGFRLVRSEFSRESNEWVGTWGKHMKSPLFKTLKTSQKLNHFAGTFQLGRKDRLWKNLQRLMLRYGSKEFGIIPQTFVLPQDLKLLKQNWECKDGSAGEKWIIKPPASARGVGIKVINKWSQLPKQTALVVQRYISDPFLINGSKFDLRLYVLVTSFNPLRIFIYPEGLVRFASVKYSDNDKDLKDRFMHLTNYSINKLSSQYTANEDANACQGHKWTLSKLWEYMETRGIDTKHLWTNLKSLVIKTMISGESPITQLCLENVNSRYNCYELFGVDVLLDQRLKPWLLEVNISPSLHSTSPLDLHVKGPLVQTLFNLAQFHLPPKVSRTESSPLCYDWRLYTTTLTHTESNKHNYYVQMERRPDYLDDILENLTGDDVRYLTLAEDELVVKGDFERIFPTAKTFKYLEFMPARYYNRLFDAWETRYEHHRQRGIELLKTMCAKKVHLKVAPPTVGSKNSLNLNPPGLPPLVTKVVEVGAPQQAQPPPPHHQDPQQQQQQQQHIDDGMMKTESMSAQSI